MIPESELPSSEPQTLANGQPTTQPFAALDPSSPSSGAKPPTLYSKRRKPTGKIAQLPKEQRGLINHLLDDGATYDGVSQEMVKHGVFLNGENVSNWFQSGYQDHLQEQDWLAEMNALRESASNLGQYPDDAKFHQAVLQVGLLQIFKSLKQEDLKDDPANHTRMLNALSRLSREALAFKKYGDLCAKATVGELKKVDYNRKLTEKERRAIVRQVDELLGLRSLDDDEPDEEGATPAMPLEPPAAIEEQPVAPPPDTVADSPLVPGIQLQHQASSIKHPATSSGPTR